MKEALRSTGLLMIAAILLLVGCTQRRMIAGRDIDAAVVNKITPGVTTKQEVSDQFGKPDQVNNKPSGEEFLYTYRGVVEETTELGLYAKKVTNDERKILRVLFNGDLVKEVTYTNSNNPKENVSKS